jgi:hypothetical protein
MLFHLLHRGVILWLQAEQLAKDFQALQQEHHRLAVTHDGEQQHSRLLQDDVTQLQVSHTYAIVMVHRPSSMLQIPSSVDENMSLDLQMYSSALEEDLGRAQAHMDLLLNGEGTLPSKQNEILKAAAKQVTPLGFACFDMKSPCALHGNMDMLSCS